jgi:3-hydroxybutyryl-CoA dehydrogenase
MGHGIAQVAAAAGFDVRLYDLEPAFVERGLERVRANLRKGVERGKLDQAAADAALGRLVATTDLDEACGGADLVVEATPEVLELKRDLFRRIAALAPPDAVLASNTSSLGIGDIAQAVPEPGQVIGMHFFNPPYVLTLLEIVRAETTSEETLAAAREAGERMGRDVIVVRDSPGFATSRLGLVLGLEAVRMLEAGVASAADIDRAMELGYRHPMGPLKLTDHVGLDVRLAIAEHLYRKIGEQFRPPELLRRMVAEGKLGTKSGEGFYRWEG